MDLNQKTYEESLGPVPETLLDSFHFSNDMYSHELFLNLGLKEISFNLINFRILLLTV